MQARYQPCEKDGCGVFSTPHTDECFTIRRGRRPGASRSMAGDSKAKLAHPLPPAMIFFLEGVEGVRAVVWVPHRLAGRRNAASPVVDNAAFSSVTSRARCVLGFRGQVCGTRGGGGGGGRPLPRRSRVSG